MNATRTRTERDHMVSYLADLIRDEGLDGPDVLDVSMSVDWDEHPDEAVLSLAAGEQTYRYLLVATEVLNESADCLVQSATEALGWGLLS